MNDPVTTVAAVIPSIPQRRELLQRAVGSIVQQDIDVVTSINVSVDLWGNGAGVTRNRALEAALLAGTEWIAFLDDDDEWMRHHLSTCLGAAELHRADVIIPWFEVLPNGGDPFPQFRGRQWDVDNPHVFPIACLVRTALIVKAQARFDPMLEPNWMLVDFPFWKALHDHGACFHAIPDSTWNWHHHGRNTSGVPYHARIKR